MKTLAQLDLTTKKHLIFDLDGTLTDSIGFWTKVEQKLVKDFGGLPLGLDEMSRERDDFIHSHTDADDIYLAHCAFLIDKYHLTLKDPHRLLALKWQRANKYLETEMDFKPGAVQLILELKRRGFTLNLATIGVPIQLDAYCHKNQKMLQQMNLEQTFDLIKTGEDVANKKPDPEIYHQILQHYHAKPAECLIFEDSYTGVLASHRAGIECVNVYDKYADPDRSKINQLADYHIANFHEFLDFVNSTLPDGR